MPEATEGPTVLRILLGTHLRRLRESREISAQVAAKAIRGSESEISRIELGRNAIREIDVLDLLTLYGVGPVKREQLLTLAEQANRPGWWHRFNDILPDWFRPADDGAPQHRGREAQPRAGHLDRTHRRTRGRAVATAASGQPASNPPWRVARPGPRAGTREGDLGFPAGRGVDVVLLDDPGCVAAMREFQQRYPLVWSEDIGGR